VKFEKKYHQRSANQNSNRKEEASGILPNTETTLKIKLENEEKKIHHNNYN